MTEPKLFPESPPIPPEPKKHPKQEQAMVGVSHMITDLSARLKIVEERYNNLRKKTQLTDQNMIETEKRFSKEVRELNESIVESKRQLSDLIDKIALLTGELKDAVRQEDFRELQKYVELWNPMEFMRREEFDKMVAEKKRRK
jgi:uncharacterized coiled-coil protein SlyX